MILVLKGPCFPSHPLVLHPLIIGSSNASASSPLQTFTNALPQIPQNLDSQDPSVITLLTQIRDEQKERIEVNQEALEEEEVNVIGASSLMYLEHLCLSSM